MAKKTLVRIFKGTIGSIETQYNEFLSKNVKIISTTITKDYTSYGYTDTFVFVVTYNQS